MAKITEDLPQLTAPQWAGDFRGRDSLIPGGARVVPSEFRSTNAVEVTAGANASVDATSITVAALSGPIPSGTVLDFGAKKFAQLTADAAAGATSISVEALATQVNAADVAWYAGTEKRTIQSGTLIGRTFAERAAGTHFGPADASDDEVYLVAFDVTDADANPDVELYRPGRVVKENFLPGFAALASGILALIRSTYSTVRGQE